MRLLITAMLVIRLMVPADSQANDEKNGFWWYETTPSEEELTEQESRELRPLPSIKDLTELHPSELAAELEARKVYAVWKQTPEAVLDYYIVQDLVRRHALAFTALTKYVLLMHPELNARSAYPISGAGRQIQTTLRAETIRDALSRVRGDYALILFSQPGCAYCASQRNALKYFADLHHWVIETIDVAERPAMRTRFNISSTPMTILIERGSERWMPIAVGLESVPAIEDSTYRAVRLLKGEISPKQYFTTEYQDGGFADTVARGGEL